jgi:hypothetical protein
VCNQITNQIYADHETFTPSQKTILLALARFCRPDDTRCYRSIRDLIGDTSLSRRCILYNLKKLRMMRVLIPIERQHGFQTKSPVYMVNLNVINGGVRSAPIKAPEAPAMEVIQPVVGALFAPHKETKDNIYIYKQKSQKSEENSQKPPNPYELWQMFEEWWRAYPRRQNKPKAFEAFQEALRHTDYDTLLRKARSYARYREKVTDKKPNQVFYTKMPHTWLGDWGWADDYGRFETTVTRVSHHPPQASTKSNEFSPYQYVRPQEIKQERPRTPEEQEEYDKWVSEVLKFTGGRGSEEEYRALMARKPIPKSEEKEKGDDNAIAA